MDAPQPYRTAAICNIVGGLFNILVNGMWILALISSCFGVVLIPVPLVLCGVGAWQAYVGMQMNGGQRVPNAAMVAMVGAITGFFSLSWLSLGLGIFAYLQVNDPDAKAFLEG